MRGIRVLACVIAIAHAGCSGRHSRGLGTVAVEEPSVASPPVEAPPPPPPDASSSEAPFFVADPKGKPVQIQRADAPNIRYARLDRASCEAELASRQIPFVRAPEAAGVRAPVRLRGPLHGVTFHTSLSAEQQEKNIVEIFDCRLVLAVDDFAQILAKHDIVEAIHLSAYRPRWAGGCTKSYRGKQHCGALAVDIGSFKKKDGSEVVIEREYHGRIGLATCAPTPRPNPVTPLATELWDIACEAARRGLFHVILTPNFNFEHRNHYHLEITPDAAWMLVR